MSSLAIQSFSRAASRYRQYAHIQAEMADWVSAWAPKERSGAALEAGAGTGLLTERLLPWRGRYVATDLSPEMCAVGRREFPEVDWPTMSAAAPLNGPWDWIFSSSMLQWSDNPAAVFKNWKQVLAPGGRVLAGLFVEGSLPELRGLMNNWAPLVWRSPLAWQQAISAAGLHLVRSEIHERIFWHASAVEMLRGLHRVGASPVRRYGAGGLLNMLSRYEARFRKGAQVRSTWTFYRFEAQA